MVTNIWEKICQVSVPVESIIPWTAAPWSWIRQINKSAVYMTTSMTTCCVHNSFICCSFLTINLQCFRFCRSSSKSFLSKILRQRMIKSARERVEGRLLLTCRICNKSFIIAGETMNDLNKHKQPYWAIYSYHRLNNI